MPKRALAQTHGEAGEAWKGEVHGPLEGDWVYLFGHDGGEAVDGGVAFPLDGGVEQTGVVQGVPGGAVAFISHREASFPQPWRV